MPIIKPIKILIGLLVCLITYTPVAKAISFERYLVVPSRTTAEPRMLSLFQVKATDSSIVEYMGIYYADPTTDTMPFSLFLSSNANPNVIEKWVGGFDSSYPAYPIGEIIWGPATLDNGSTDPYVAVYLFKEDGSDAYGDIKLVADTIIACDWPGSCYPTQKVFTTSRGQAKRMTTLNGDQIEVVPVIIRLDGAPWATYYFGYGVGVVAAEVFSSQLNVQSFSPVNLPPPKAEGTVVEYVNTLDFPNAPGGHFFYTADPAEQAGVDAGGAGHFTRTGRSFASGGFLPVCRFYGSMSPGPNSHFFTAAENECEGLKAMQVTPTPATIQQWNYEGLGFYSVVPVRDAQGQMQCMDGTEPVYRAYNNAYPMIGDVRNPWDSNHRYSTQRADIDEMVSKGWRDEGIVLCAPVVAQ